MNKATPEIKKRLEELRTILRSENISHGELIELQDLTQYIEEGDVELLEPAGVPENPISTKTFTITLEGKSQSDIESAMQEVMNAIQSGYHCGANSNYDGLFSFESSGEYDD